MDEVVTQEATLRVMRTIVAISGIATLVFLTLTIASIANEWSYVDPTWHVSAIVIVFGVPIVLACVCFLLGVRTMKIVLGCYAIAALVVSLTFPLAMTAGPLPVQFSPWPLTITALNTVPAALAFSAPVAWVYLFVDSVSIALVRWLANGPDDLTIALQDAFFSFTFAGIFTALAIVSMRSASALDSAAAKARVTAVRRASVTASNREQARLDALLHDDVMSTLFYASQGNDELDAAVRRQAAQALAELARFGESSDVDPAVDAEAFTSRLRSVILQGATGASFSVMGSRERLIPGDVAAAFAEAAAEAVRNSMTHGGADGRTVTVTAAASVNDGGIDVTIEDDGPGFDAGEIRPHRLGILVSIHGRMSAVTGGSATVESRPGAGTVVDLRWRQP